MTFTSFNFLIFFPLVALAYYITPLKLKWITLLVASYFFYINVKPVFALLLAGITVSTYIFTRLIDKTKVELKKRRYLQINLILILLPLFFFKYFDFINNGIYGLLESLHISYPLPEIKLILPIGISFYTFMAIGYTVDVYNEEIEPERNIGILALFISFFPLILSGPIERAKNMLPQFKSPINIEYESVAKGLKLMLWGYFMKLVVADRLGIYVNTIYNNISHHNGTSLLVASILGPFQMYADFGGYSLIAVGVAKVMGIKVMHNFNRPFFATSMSQFWRRWHISLISWLTDYLYTPISFAFRRYKLWGMVLALFFTFFISGIWHGASWPFVVWGLIQGVYLTFELLTNRRKAKFEKKYKLTNRKWYILAGTLLTLVLFTVSQIFGGTNSIGDSLVIFEKIFILPGSLFIGRPSELIFSMLGLITLMTKEFIDEYYPSRFLFFENKIKFIRILSYSFIIIVILLIGVFDGGQFIYFQF